MPTGGTTAARPHWCGGRRRVRRAWLRCPWAAARPGRASRRRTEQHQRPGPTGVKGAGGICRGAGGRWQGLAGLRGDAPSEARSADGERAGRRPPAHTAAGPSGARNTSGATSTNTQRGRLAGGPPPTGAPSSPAQQGTRGSPAQQETVRKARRSSPSEPCARAGASRPGRSGCGPRCAAPHLRCR